MISVIIPNWNGQAHLPTCLGALRRQTHPDFEVLVVDNASTDASCQMVLDDYPEVRLVTLPTNRGLTGGVNVGINEARGETVALLNNDTEAHPYWLAALQQALDEHPEAGSIASKMMLFDRRDVIHSAGDYYRRDGIPGNRGVWEEDRGQYDEPGWVFGGCGGAVAYRKAMLDEIGLLDEDLFMYCEDVDLAWRAQLAGYPCWYQPSAVIYHRLSATGGGPLSSYYTGRNTVLVWLKNTPGPLLQRDWPLALRAQMRIAAEALRSWRGAAARARLRGQVAGLALALPWLGKRRQVQASRRVSLDYIASILSPVPPAGS
ncbi:MAG: glycosyltransferase family 2 protein [Chloroflexi bacterium]|nr:glycosyltransferase family 2 protein [Chloroflexota bacterium]